MSDDVKAAAERLMANSWDTYCGEPGNRNWMDIADKILGDGRMVAKHLIVLSAAPTQDALKAAGEICDRQEWNSDIIPELAKELGMYAAGLRTSTLDAEGFDHAMRVLKKAELAMDNISDETGDIDELNNASIDVCQRYEKLRPHLRSPERDAEIRREAIELCAKRIEDGYFLHDQAPTALFAKEAAKAIRSLT